MLEIQQDRTKCAFRNMRQKNSKKCIFDSLWILLWTEYNIHRGHVEFDFFVIEMIMKIINSHLFTTESQTIALAASE